MKKLYVGNLPFQATEQEITNCFQQAGVTVASVSLVTSWLTKLAREGGGGCGGYGGEGRGREGGGRGGDGGGAGRY